ncbi:MAG: hypothetical protein ACKOWI_04265, partial [Rhodoluna sp.]
MQKKALVSISAAFLLVAGLIVPVSSAFADGEIVFVGDVDTSPPISNQFPDLIPPEGPSLASPPEPTVNPSTQPGDPTAPVTTSPTSEPVYAVQTPIVQPPTSPAESPAPTSAETEEPVETSVEIVKPAKPIQVPLKPGSTAITPAAKTVLTKTVASVVATDKPATIAISLVGVSLTKAAKQANALVVELRKLGATAITKVSRVSGK